MFKKKYIKFLLISLFLFILSTALLYSAAPTIAITITPASGATSLNLSNGSGPNDVLVATILEESTKKNHIVTVYSTNGSKLTGDVYGDTLSYKATYTDYNSGLEFDIPTIETPLTISSGAKGTFTKYFHITYTIVDFVLSADTYRDTLYFVISN